MNNRYISFALNTFVTALHGYAIHTDTGMLVVLITKRARYKVRPFVCIKDARFQSPIVYFSVVTPGAFTTHSGAVKSDRPRSRGWEGSDDAPRYSVGSNRFLSKNH